MFSSPLYLVPLLLSSVVLASRGWGPWFGPSESPWGGEKDQAYKHVLVFSVDGFHSSDVSKYLAIRPKSTIALLLETGVQFTDAYTSAPSDSFPGTMNQMTGAHPRTTGVWYDDTYDRSFYPPGSNCFGPAGAEVVYDESIDFNSTELFSGGIDPVNLPRKIVGGKCTEVYPHARLRVNTVFEVVQSHGYETAYTDKHPAYDIVRGPSGKGLTVGYFPEIASVNSTVDATIPYDQLHVNAFLDWIDGNTPEHSEGSLSKTPTLFGGNFQSVSVGEKEDNGGYENDGKMFSAQLLKAFDFVDVSLGKVVAKLKANGIYDDSLIIIASKHGQAPINRALYGTVDPDLLQNASGVAVDHMTADDIGLFFLSKHSDTEKAVANLNAKRGELKIQDIIYGQRLLDEGFGNPLTDPAVPDIIVRPDLGIIYTTSTAKIAEHGGISDDDRKVACFLSNPKFKKSQYGGRVSTRQVAPTILEALGIDTQELQGVQKEGTKSLLEFCKW